MVVISAFEHFIGIRVPYKYGFNLIKKHKNTDYDNITIILKLYKYFYIDLQSIKEQLVTINYKQNQCQ